MTKFDNNSVLLKKLGYIVLRFPRPVSVKYVIILYLFGVEREARTSAKLVLDEGIVWKLCTPKIHWTDVFYPDENLYHNALLDGMVYSHA